jgi:DNA-binding CsgD family transcriptional regulator
MNFFGKQRLKNLLYSSSYFHVAFMISDIVRKNVILYNYNTSLKNIFDNVPNETEIEEEIFLQLIPEQKRQFFSDCITVINEYMFWKAPDENIPYSFTFNIPFISAPGIEQMISCRIFPYYYTSLSKDRKPQAVYFQFDFSLARVAGNLTLHLPTQNSEYKYFVCRSDQPEPGYLVLNKQEIALFYYSGEGLSENEIASKLNINLSMLKHQKSNIMLQLNAISTTQVITMLSKQGLI